MLASGCAGFPLGYPSRADIDINTKYTYLVQDRRPDASVCQPGRQDVPGNNNPFPPALVIPGQTLHLTWQPDGHLDDARPSLVEVHWTGIPGLQLHTRLELNRSTLLGVLTFATSANCDQPWDPNTTCHGYLTIPWGTQPGTYQLIWWWKYNRNSSGQDSTCFEIVVSDDSMQPHDLAVQALPHIEESIPSSPLSSLPLSEERNDQNKPPQRFQMAYVRADRVETNDGAFPEEVRDEEALQKTTTLTELTTKPDEPFSVFVTVLIAHSNKNRVQKNGYYVDDETGVLAGDAINDQEGVDTSPLVIETPSQLINSTLSEQVKKIADSNGNSNGTMNTTKTQGSSGNSEFNDSSNNTNNTTDIKTGVPYSKGASPLNSTSVGHVPTLDSGASDI
ncbi:hypothetical protein BGZ65_008096, partial [Modicella reniformis]